MKLWLSSLEFLYLDTVTRIPAYYVKFDRNYIVLIILLGIGICCYLSVFIILIVS